MYEKEFEDAKDDYDYVYIWTKELKLFMKGECREEEVRGCGDDCGGIEQRILRVSATGHEDGGR